MADTRIGIVRRIIWPAKASLFALIGGAVGLFGDLVNFFAEFLSANVLVIIFAVITAVAALLCFQRAFMVNAADDKAVDEVVQCAACDGFRFGLFATAAFILLMLVGQGQSATEAVGLQLGLIKVEAPLHDVRPVERPKQAGAQKRPVELGAASAPSELNLRGERVEAALELLRDFLIEAHALKAPSVRVLHGKGTGALRDAVRTYLKSEKLVERFEDAVPYEGGHGVTVAYLRY